MPRKRTCVEALNRTLGHLLLRQINQAVINSHLARRQSEGLSARTVNIEHVTLRNVLRKAMDDDYLNSLAIDGIKWLPYRPEKRRLVTRAEIEILCETAKKVRR